jgi:hypothetical protein
MLKIFQKIYYKNTQIKKLCFNHYVIKSVIKALNLC